MASWPQDVRHFASEEDNNDIVSSGHFWDFAKPTYLSFAYETVSSCSSRPHFR